AAGRIDQRPGLTQLVEGTGNELLPTKAWVDAHQQDHVDLVHHVLQAVQRGGRIEHQARLGAARLDQLQGAINVLGGFRVEGDIAGAGFEEVADDAVYRFDHQVGVDRRSDAIFAQRRADDRK